ncbi:unnamed protein product [Thelazia callipaeda]|uniref:Protein-serine/threonine phosphatase n=1 Tax=Thelazia callipaeda TaxID=103827 RepID=A0A0N5D9D7_THECL|nr:unnamed protein product [Thelazia callipaeda]
MTVPSLADRARQPASHRVFIRVLHVTRSTFSSFRHVCKVTISNWYWKIMENVASKRRSNSVARDSEAKEDIMHSKLSQMLYCTRWYFDWYSNGHLFWCLGYSLCSHCVVISLTSIFHLLHSHLLFYAMAVIFCVSSILRVSLYLCSRTHGMSQKLIITTVTFVLHLSYLWYLHYGFHAVVEGIREISEILGDEGQIGVSSAYKLKY